MTSALGTKRTATAFAFIIGAFAAGCQPGQPQGGSGGSTLAGTWAVTRGAAKVDFSWTTSGGGQTHSDSSSGELVPLDPGQFPPVFAPLVDQWNASLAAFNEQLDAAMPASVVISFPRAGAIRMVDAADASRAIEGLFLDDKYLFADDFTGSGEGSDQGGGAVLQLSTIDGQFDRAALTTTGKIARTMLVALLGPNQSGLVFTAQISVAYTARRTGDAPTPTPRTTAQPTLPAMTPEP